MSEITHQQQQELWDKEHQDPYVLKQMDVIGPSSGVVKFIDYLTDEKIPHATGVEMCCGKGRNGIGLAKQLGIWMFCFDFSPHAIAEATKRAEEAGVGALTHFVVADATTVWPYESNSMDFGIDCFGSTDIESLEGRKIAMSEMYRVLKPGGHFLAYLLSTEDEFHKEMIQIRPASERNSFLHPTTGKFEKTYDDQDIHDTFKGFETVQKDRVQKTTEFFGKTYACKHYWIIFKKK